mmetsp:Transcript_29640/g.39560  ORF Transcript_29640/g.39560 Transcript_29640/m.39560 type:complete len:400 (+) Transcript_29640:202-1401(+)
MRTSKAEIILGSDVKDAQSASDVAKTEENSIVPSLHRRKSACLAPRPFQHRSSISTSILTVVVIIFTFDVNCSNTHGYVAASDANPVCDPPCQNNAVCISNPVVNATRNRMQRRAKSNGELGVCECTEGYGGPSCEKSCTLRCYNGGLCNPFLQVGGLTSCDCSEPYEGRQCDIEKCGNGQLSCLNGSKCTKRSTGDYECDCTEAHGPYAGPLCEYEATTFCALDGSDSNSHFCVNGGKCIEKVPSHESHKGCDCASGYTGEHCQYVMEIPKPSGTRPTETRPTETRPPPIIQKKSPSRTKKNHITSGFNSRDLASIFFFVAFILSVTAMFACIIMTLYTTWKVSRQRGGATYSDLLMEFDNESSADTDALSVDFTDDGTDSLDGDLKKKRNEQAFNEQ